MCPFSTVTEPNFLRYDNACALSSVPQPHSGYTDHNGMCAKTTIGVLLLRRLTSFSSHSSCSLPRLPNPPAFRLSTFTRPMKCTPFLSKLCQPAPRLAERHSLQHPAGHRPHGTGADPCHAPQKPSTIDVLVFVFLRHTRLLQPEPLAAVTHTDRTARKSIPELDG